MNCSKTTAAAEAAAAAATQGKSRPRAAFLLQHQLELLNELKH
jgi:hypothetical protein